MTDIQMLTIILSIGVPMLAGFGWIVMQLFKMQKDIAGTKIEIASFKTEIVGVKNDMLNMKIEILNEVRILDSRIAHIEGYLIGFNQKTGTEKK